MAACRLVLRLVLHNGNAQLLLRRFAAVNQNEAENLLRQRGSDARADGISAHGAKVTGMYSVKDTSQQDIDVNTKSRQSAEQDTSKSDEDRQEMSNSVKDLESVKSELKKDADAAIKSIEEEAKSLGVTKDEEAEKAKIEQQLKTNLAENQKEIEDLKAKIAASTKSVTKSNTENDSAGKTKAYHDKDSDTPLHPYHHPDVNNDSAKIGDAPSKAQVKSSREHYAHKHVPTLLDAMELKRKELFRSQELIDYGSIVVVSNGSYVIVQIICTLLTSSLHPN